jgi:ribose 1,5-bisphosphokinase PhnN
MHILLITGPSGVGKSTLCWEMSHQLAAAQVLAAIPDARISAVRLAATDATLLERLAQREIGSGVEEQAERSLRQAKRIAGQDQGDAVIVSTDGESPQGLAGEILRKVGWLAGGTGIA